MALPLVAVVAWGGAYYYQSCMAQKLQEYEHLEGDHVTVECQPKENEGLGFRAGLL